MRARVLLTSCALFITSSALPATWKPSAGHVQVPLWPGTPPGQPVFKATESVTSTGPKDDIVRDVSTPTLTVYPPAGKNSGAAVLVFPGGGYQLLAMDLEGTDVCDWLGGIGVTCVLLKYRVPCLRQGPYRDCPMALQDAQRALGLVRLHAAEWGVDPHKLGVLGFSAGGHMAAAISTHFEKRSYAPVDAADKENGRPDFALVLYPGHLASESSPAKLNPDIRVGASTPPSFLLQAQDDPVDPVANTMAYHAALLKAKVPVELHVFAKGGHAFGLRPTDKPITRWPALAETWLRSQGVLPAVSERPEESALRFVRDFYAWYRPAAEKAGAEEEALRNRAELFTPGLLTALKEDLAASKKNGSEIVGLDFDPFLNSQDPCPRYDVGGARIEGGRALVDVKGDCVGEKTGPDVTAELAPGPKGWVFSDFRYPYEKSGLLKVLDELRRSRDAAH
jgi:acetyl esterase/lipase